MISSRVLGFFLDKKLFTESNSGYTGFLLSFNFFSLGEGSPQSMTEKQQQHRKQPTNQKNTATQTNIKNPKNPQIPNSLVANNVNAWEWRTICLVHLSWLWLFPFSIVMQLNMARHTMLLGSTCSHFLGNSFLLGYQQENHLAGHDKRDQESLHQPLQHSNE